MHRMVTGIAVMLLAGVIFCSCGLLFPSHHNFSGPIPHGGLGGTIDFSPDAKMLAYVWKDASYVNTPKYEGRPCTLTESLEVRVCSVNGTNEELRVSLDSIDLRPDGVLYYSLGCGLQTGPDSKHVAAICARRLVLIDFNARTHQEIEYAGEYFCSFSWLNAYTLVFSTIDKKSLTFWRWQIADPPAKRVKVYAENQESHFENLDNRPPNQNSVGSYQWSPNGRFVTFWSRARQSQGEDALLDLETGAVHTFPFSLFYQCWKPDCTAVLVQDKFSNDDRTLVMLVDPVTGDKLDLTKDFEKEFGSHMKLTFVAPLWTPDGKYVLLYNTSERSTALQRGCLIQLNPFKILMEKDQILRWSPVPGWVLLQGDNTFKWLDYAGNRTANISGWPNDWRWSNDGSYAATISGQKIKIFKPELPPTN